ncbi:MAG: hemerythrin domain-containing protein, partial [Bacteroidales bacterium]|nr:hemerythrin domain-containing protein [Bacteroidales bacterium]
ERNLFPYIADMQQGRRRNDYSIYDFVQTHSSSIEDKLSDLTLILFKYLPEKKSDNDVIDLIFDLMELTSDLNKHATIEDKILVPYVETLEKGADK